MDLDGDGRKDYACVDKNGKMDIYLNVGEADWTHFGTAATGASIKDGKGVLFAE